MSTPLFGYCAPCEQSALARQQGWDFIEENAQKFLQGETPDEKWHGVEMQRRAALPVVAANSLVPGHLKITGPDANLQTLETYMSRVIPRGETTNIRRLVFGSGVARNIPDGFDRCEARKQIIAFLKMTAPILQKHEVIIVIEPLNKGECNIITSVAEAMEYVREVDHPNIQCLVDSFHFWLENESLQNIVDAGTHIRHVHVADKDGRTPPGLSGKADYRPFFASLKKIRYSGIVSIEAKLPDDWSERGKSVLEYMKDQWKEA